MNTNILNWYPFKKSATILYLAIYEEKDIEEYLASICNELKIIRFFNKEKSQIETLDNIEKINEKYDYVILLGTLEYANEIIKEPNAYIKMLYFAKERLKEDGTILLAVDNRMGVKYLVGNRSKHCNSIYDSVKNKYEIGKMFSKSEIDKIIDTLNFKYRKNYYPLPNYKYANVIYTDELLPEKNDSKINYNVIYDEQSLILQDETNLLKQFIREGNFKEYTNSYFIELSDSNIKNNIKYVSHNNMRKEEFSLILKMYEDVVEKHMKTPIAKNHIIDIKNNIKKLKSLGFELAEEDSQDDIIKSKFIKHQLLDSYIVKLIKQENISEVYELIDKWYSYIKQKLNVDENGYVKDGFIDMVFENTFYNEKEESFIFFDQEWYKENIPVDFILYRAIQNLYAHNKSLNNYLPIEDIANKYNINDNAEFEQLERELQEKVIDEEKRKFYSEQYKYMISSEEVLKIIEDLKRFDRDNAELIGEINRIKNMSILEFVKNKMKR